MFKEARQNRLENTFDINTKGNDSFFMFYAFLMKQKIFLALSIFLLTILGVSVYSEFMANHSYYNDMFQSRNNRKMIIWMTISALIPLGYIFWSKAFSAKSFFLKWIPAGLVFSSTAFLLIKESIFGSTWFLILCFNTLLIYAIGAYFLWGLLSIGTWISDKRIKFSETRRQEMAINFGIGLWVFLLLIKMLLIFDMLYPVITRIVFLSFGVAIYINRKKLTSYGNIVGEMMEGFNKSAINKDRTKRIGLVLIAIALIYYFYGFQLSYIPYSTAWDANHEYMYTPKILAENFGVLRGNAWPWSVAPQLWHSLLAFRFSFSESIPKFRMGPNTLPVAINFLAGPLTLLLGIGTIKQILAYFKKEDDDTEQNTFSFYLWWFLLLLRLTSGMWAFLVFVDNKTDLGVMSITILALLSGFIFLEYLKHHNTKEELKMASKYIIISWVFFALANMAKQTAFIDIVLFGLLMISLWFSTTVTIWLGTMVIWVTGIMGIANAKDILSPSTGTRIAAFVALITLIGIGQLLRKHKKSTEKTLLQSLKYLWIRVGTIAITVLVFKGSHQLYSSIKDGSFTPSNFVKNIIVGQRPTLLAANTSPELLTTQTIVDQNSKSNLSPAVCAQTSFSTGELEAHTKKAIVTNEDVGRYVGYGRKEIKKWGRSVGYGLLRILFPINNTCYGTDHDAKILCENGAAVDWFKVKVLRPLLKDMKSGSQAYNLLSGALANFTNKWYKDTDTYNAQEFRDNIVALRNYYQSNAIMAVEGSVAIPYKYIIPLNISFNRSLQNLSSYYTDIGFIRVFAMGLILLWFIYGLIQRDKNLVTVTSVSILGWAIWWVIWGGILWYGMGLIVRTILGTIIYINSLGNSKDKSESTSLAFVFFILLLSIWGVLQLFFNLIRISSQGVGWPFARYRMNIWQTTEFDDTLQQKDILKNGYTWKDVFDLQFPHYNKFINYVQNRKNEDGVLIAGTYLQYFLKNQWYLNLDGMLSVFWELASDGDSCKSAQRLKNAHIKYLVVDPNIGTVGMGEGNESLFQRFFAKLDPVSGKIEKQGAISMLIKMKDDGFLKLLNTNNLWAKYAFTLDDATLSAGLKITNPDDLLLAKAKLSVARYFPDANSYIQFIAETLVTRIQNGLAMWDIADVLGKNIDEAKLLKAAAIISANTIQDEAGLKAFTKELTQDERYILTQYIGILKMAQADQTQFQQAINGIISQSLGGSSQLMTFEVTQ